MGMARGRRSNDVGELGDRGMSDPAVGERMLMTWPTGEVGRVCGFAYFGVLGGMVPGISAT